MRGHFLDEADGRRAAQDARRDAAAERRVGCVRSRAVFHGVRSKLATTISAASARP